MAPVIWEPFSELVPSQRENTGLSRVPATNPFASEPQCHHESRTSGQNWTNTPIWTKQNNMTLQSTSSTLWSIGLDLNTAQERVSIRHNVTVNTPSTLTASFHWIWGSSTGFSWHKDYIDTLQLTLWYLTKLFHPIYKKLSTQTSHKYLLRDHCH